jgi:proteasome lid subunit RPN8/RPN11
VIEIPLEKVIMDSQVVDSLLSYSRMAYPDEGILLLRGRSKKGLAEVTGVVVPPAAVHARSYSSFSWWMIPIDLSYLGVAHSHPSGHVIPSQEDLLHATGRMMVIVGYPFANESCIGIFDHNGRRIPFEVRRETHQR